MNPQDFDNLLLQTLDDSQLSRGEKQILSELLAEQAPDENKLAQYRARAFEAARASVPDPQAHKVLTWLEEVVKALQKRIAPPVSAGVESEAHFSPGDTCPGRIASLISATRRKLDVCVFTITDDRISRPLIEAHQRGVVVRIITDNEKLLELGSDVEMLAAEGIQVKVDQTPFHMHHKFALFDERLLLTGSYNWTRSAADKNQENFIVTGETKLLAEFQRTFNHLWSELSAFN